MPRIGDVYAALPAITGKLELEYEGEMKGADHVSRELIRTAVAKTYDDVFQRRRTCSRSCNGSTWAAKFKLADTASAAEALQSLRRHSGPDGKDSQSSASAPRTARRVQVSAAEFILEGLHAHKRIGRNEERVFTAGEKQPKRPEKPFEREEHAVSRTKTVQLASVVGLSRQQDYAHAVLTTEAERRLFL